MSLATPHKHLQVDICSGSVHNCQILEEATKMLVSKSVGR